MILITGGAYQGKASFAEKIYRERTGTGNPLICDENTTDKTDFLKADIVVSFHKIVSVMLRNGDDPGRLADALISEGRDVIIVCDELGCGIVPSDSFDRQWRETTGRLCCLLADNSQEVYRVVCGIGSRIK